MGSARTVTHIELKNMEERHIIHIELGNHAYRYFSVKLDTSIIPS